MIRQLNGIVWGDPDQMLIVHSIVVGKGEIATLCHQIPTEGYPVLGQSSLTHSLKDPNSIYLFHFHKKPLQLQT